MGDSATYVFCLVRGAKPPTLARLPPGLPGASKPRLLRVEDGLWLVVCDAPLALYDEAEIARGLKDLDWVSRCAVAHEAVVERFARSPALVPMKLFTLFLSDARAVEDVRRRRGALARVLAHVEGR